MKNKLIWSLMLLTTVGCAGKKNASNTDNVMITPDGRKTPVINPDRIKISAVEIGIQAAFNGFCETDAQINKRETLSQAGDSIYNQYRFNNGGLIQATLRIEENDGQVVQVESMDVKYLRCSDNMIVLNPDNRKITVVYPDATKLPVLSPTGRKIPVITPNSTKLPVISPASKKIPVINPTAIKISAVESQVQAGFNELCTSDVRISHREKLIENGEVISNQYRLNNGGMVSASIETEIQDGKIVHSKLLNMEVLNCK